MATRIPHLLEPYLALPPECAQILLTSVLGASTNWLVLRYLYSYLHKTKKNIGASHADGNSGGEGPENVNVVLVSFMRDFAFWKEDAGRFGLDLESLSRRGRFIYVDGLTALFAPSKTPPQGTSKRGHRLLTSPELSDVRRELLAAVSDASSRDETSSVDGPSSTPAPKTVLIVDQPDFLLAASADLHPTPPTGVETEAASNDLILRNLLLDVREKVHASIITVSADDPLVTAGANGTGLEREHAGFVLSLAHGSEVILGLRLLDTGSASDVSGVVRVTRGGAGLGEGEGEGKGVGRSGIEEGEFLYFVGGDGSVNVFHRGQGG